MKNIFYSLILIKMVPNHRLLTVLTLLIYTTSCEKDLDVGLPASHITGHVVFEDKATVRAALAEVYAKLRDVGIVAGTPSGTSLLMGLYADEMDFYGVGAHPADSFYSHSLIPSSTAVAEFWNHSYHLIYACNAIIEGLENSTSLPEEVTDLLKGEAYFLRGFLHFNLLNLFGDIPYITGTDYRINSTVSRRPEEEIHGFIIEDLLLAQILLPAVEETGERILVHSGAAEALLARVYLYMEDWERAVEAASGVLNNGLYAWHEDLETLFLKNSPTTIWQLKPGTEGFNTHEAKTFKFETGPPPFTALRADLVSAFEEGDLRRQAWIGEVSDGTNHWYYANKYKLYLPMASTEEYSILLRLAEQYLIRAEARVELGDFNGARQDLNKVRQRAGLHETTAGDREALREGILKERRAELFTEQGHRWFDLKRSGTAGAVLSGIKPGWRATHILLPLPEEELILNPNLEPQNPGY